MYGLAAMKMQRFYYYSCLFFILIMPLQNISFFDIGFKGSLTNLLIILIFLKLTADYLIFYNFRKIVNVRIFSYESKFLLLPLCIVMCFDVLSTVYHGGFGFLADRIGTVLLVIIFIVGIDSYEKLKKIPICWLFASSCLAAQNILSNLGLTPIIEGARVEMPRTFYGVKMPFNYTAGFPGAFGWHGMLLVSGFIFSIYYVKKNKFIGYLCGMLCMTSIIMMQSRSTYLAVVVSLMVYLLTIFYVNNKYKQLALLFSPTILIFVYYLPDITSYIGYIWEGFVNVERLNVDSRLYQFQVGIEAGLEHWFLGTGHNYEFNSVSGVVIHNSFLYQLASIGVAGFLVYCYIYYKSFLTSIKIILFNKLFVIEHGLIVALFSMLIGVCIELSLFRVISGKEQWLIIYFILLYCAQSHALLKHEEQRHL